MEKSKWKCKGRARKHKFTNGIVVNHNNIGGCIRCGKIFITLHQGFTESECFIFVLDGKVFESMDFWDYNE